MKSLSEALFLIYMLISCGFFFYRAVIYIIFWVITETEQQYKYGLYVWGLADVYQILPFYIFLVAVREIPALIIGGLFILVKAYLYSSKKIINWRGKLKAQIWLELGTLIGGFLLVALIQ